MNINKLKKLEEEYKKRNKAFLEKDTISGFISFIKDQRKKGNNIITLEQRETARRLKEMKERQKKNKPFDPEEDFNNLKR